ncbi:ATP-binding protein [Streptomyces sp. NBC_01477]|uniref:ATP-binding protein n=1 Tax=Streptomyces sp. NBC_01477 TaxID=2976015 RepID=UPI002E317E8A|nr:ATP-binding protein [Streptomyces sp. NBC_01477]
MALPIASTGLKAPQHRTKATVEVSAARDFTSRPEYVREVRAFTRDALAGLDHAVGDIVLCVSELATNAVRHSTPHDGTFHLDIRVGRDKLRVECHDSGSKKPTLQTPSDADEGGRGLLLVQALASRWGVSSRPLGKCVWFEIDGDPSVLQGCRRAGRADS